MGLQRVGHDWETFTSLDHLMLKEVKSLSRVRLFATPWPVAHQAPLSMGFSRQEHWLEWVAIFFSRGYSRPWDRTQVSCIAGRCFNLWATRDAWKWKWKCSVVSNSLQPHRLHSPWNSPGQNTEVDSLSPLQGIFQPRAWTQVSRIVDKFFTHWATREAPLEMLSCV